MFNIKIGCKTNLKMHSIFLFTKHIFTKHILKVGDLDKNN